MTRKKGIYDLFYFATKGKSEKTLTSANWKQILEKLNSDHKDFINVKDLEHTSEPFIKIVTSETALGSVKDPEEYFYTKRK